MEIYTYRRKPFDIEAIQVDFRNMEEVCQWAGGTIQENERGVSYIHIKTHRPINDKQSKAFAGDWVMKSKTGFKVYVNKAFVANFERINKTVEPVKQEESSEGKQLLRNIFEQPQPQICEACGLEKDDVEAIMFDAHADTKLCGDCRETIAAVAKTAQESVVVSTREALGFGATHEKRKI